MDWSLTGRMWLRMAESEAGRYEGREERLARKPHDRL